MHRIDRGPRRGARIHTLGRIGAALLLLGATGRPDTARAECATRPASATRPVVQGFLIRPLSLLERNPQGGDALAATVAEVVAGDHRAALGPVIRLIGSANLDQKRAIGLGLSNAAAACRSSRPEIADAITRAVLARDDALVTATVLHPDRTEAPPPPAAPAREPRGRPIGDPFRPVPLPGK